MKLTYSVPEKVWNAYEITGIEESHLEEELKKDPNIWNIQSKLALDGIHISIELSEACYDFIDTYYEDYELNSN